MCALRECGLYDDLGEEENKNKRAKRRCKIRKCGDRTSWYCDACSNLNLVPPKIVCMCNPFTKNGSLCYQNHIDDLGIQ